MVGHRPQTSCNPWDDRYFGGGSLCWRAAVRLHRARHNGVRGLPETLPAGARGGKCSTSDLGRLKRALVHAETGLLALRPRDQARWRALEAAVRCCVHPTCRSLPAACQASLMPEIGRPIDVSPPPLFIHRRNEELSRFCHRVEMSRGRLPGKGRLTNASIKAAARWLSPNSVDKAEEKIWKRGALARHT